MYWIWIIYFKLLWFLQIKLFVLYVWGILVHIFLMLWSMSNSRVLSSYLHLFIDICHWEVHFDPNQLLMLACQEDRGFYNAKFGSRTNYTSYNKYIAKYSTIFTLKIKILLIRVSQVMTHRWHGVDDSADEFSSTQIRTSWPKCMGSIF